MQNKIIIVAFLIFSSFCTCKQSVLKKEIHINYEFVTKWKIDSFGCLGLRDKLITDSFKVFKRFKGLDYNIFVENFGKAIKAIKKNPNTVYIYFIGCSIAPKVKFSNRKGDTIVLENNENGKREINTESKNMYILVDSINIIRNINVICP